MKIMKILFFLALVVCPLGLLAYLYWPEQKLPYDSIIDKICVIKHKRLMRVYHDDTCLKTYTVSLGQNPKGHKQYEGDSKTPEGEYTINDKSATSGYYKNLGVSYPNKKDTDYAHSHGQSPGGLIKIHGMKNGQGFLGKFHRWFDWTAGCIAVTDAEMEELFRTVKIGTRIIIRP